MNIFLKCKEKIRKKKLIKEEDRRLEEQWDREKRENWLRLKERLGITIEGEEDKKE